MRKILSILTAILACLSMTASADFSTAFWQKLNVLSDYPNTTGLIALWQMDENPSVVNGATIHDYLGNHNGTLTGKATNMSMTGMRFRAIDFSGGNYYVTVPSSTAFNKTSSSTFTIMGWYNPSKTNNTSCWFALNSASTPWGPTSGDTSYTKSIAFWDGSQYRDNGSNLTFTNGSWYHLAYVLNGGSLQLYYNGNLVGSTAASTVALTNTGLYMGYDPSDVNYTNARLDEVSIWNRAMSASEIQTIYNNQAFGSSNAISISNLTASGITTTGFTSTITFAGDLNNNSTATLYYCDATTTPGCTPTSGSSTSMSKSGSLFTGTVSGLAYSPGDYVNFQVSVSDADGVNSITGSPTTGSLSGQLRLTPNTPTLIYRSVATGATSALVTGSGANTMTISGSTATFSAALANNIGVGDAIQYDPADSATPSQIVFISGRTSSTSFTVLTAAGAAPTAGTSLQNWSLFRAYTSLKNALAGTENTGINAAVRAFDTVPKNLVTANQRWIVALYGNGTTAETTYPVNVTGWTTDVDRYVQVYTPTLSTEVGTSQRAAGVWDTSKWHLTANDANASPCYIFCVTSSNTRIMGIQVENTATTQQSDIFDFATGAGGYQYVAYNIFRMTTTPTGGSAINLYCAYIAKLAASSTLYIYNNIVYGCGSGIGFDATNASTTFSIYSNTVYGNNQTGFRITNGGATTTTIVIDNIAYNNGTDLYINTMSGPQTYSTNLTKDTTGTQATLTFANTAAQNYLLASTDTAAIGTGTDLGHPAIQSNFSFNDDILGASRTAGQWDIGAHQQ